MSEPAKGEISGPLSGVKILDLTSVVLGPFATQILASLGAQVVKIETKEGDSMRHVGPMKNAGMGHIFLHANSGKQSVVLDLKSADGLQAMLALACTSDVLISNVRPAAMARLGLDFESVKKHNPRIIHVNCSGFAQKGPYAAKPAYDDLIQGAAGVPWLMKQHGSQDPSYVPLTLADRVTGLHAVYAVTAALYEREKTGVGQAVIVPMFEAMSQFVLGDHLAGQTFNPPIGDAGYARLLTRHRRPYQTADGYLCVLIYNDKHWKNFFSSVPMAKALQADPRFLTHTARAENIEAVYAEVSQLMQSQTTAQWQAILEKADIPHMPMGSPEDLLSDPHLLETGFIQTVAHPTEGSIQTTGRPTQWSNHAKPIQLSPAPQIGEHTASVLRGLGYDEELIARIMAQTTSAVHKAALSTRY